MDIEMGTGMGMDMDMDIDIDMDMNMDMDTDIDIGTDMNMNMNWDMYWQLSGREKKYQNNADRSLLRQKLCALRNCLQRKQP